jgi:hypothetical protein
MRLVKSVLVAGALLAAPLAAQENNAAAIAPANEVVAADTNAEANMPEAAPAPEAAAPEAPAPAPAKRGLPWGAIGLLGLIGLLGVRKVKA